MSTECERCKNHNPLDRVDHAHLPANWPEGAVEVEALRLANLHLMPTRRVRFLGTLNPESQAHYREAAIKSLGGK